MMHQALAIADRLTVRVRRAPLLDPLDVFAQAGGTSYARIKAEGLEAVSVGEAWSTQAAGPGRFHAVARAAAALAATLRIDGDLPFPLRLWGGFSFDDTGGRGAWQNFASAHWFLPAYQYLRLADRAYEISIEGESGRVPTAAAADLTCATPAEWMATCEHALAAIRRGELHKVVIARAERRELSRSFNLAATLAGLRASADGQIFAFEHGGDWFVSATPELVWRNHGAEFKTNAVAGTVARYTDAETSAAALLASHKDREEHAWVVEGIRDALRGRTTRLECPAAPQVMTLPRLQHLYTPISGALRPGLGAMDAVAALHPTAALSGYPQAAAVRWLRRYGGLERGWYAAPVGWLDLAGDAALWAAIRSALIRGDHAYLFAGAGIVADSQPDAEWRETELKLSTMRRAFEGAA